ncbi:MAG TPA: STAS domain-containing protein [Trebonia sp.]|jgi:anti-sigma B factor antagonist
MEEILTLQVRRRPGYVLVAAAGEIDISTVPRLRGVLSALAVRGMRVIVDLEEVSFIDASGLGALAAAVGRAAAAGGSLHVTAVPPCVRRLIAVTGLDRHLLTAAAETKTEVASGSSPALPNPGPS